MFQLVYQTKKYLSPQIKSVISNLTGLIYDKLKLNGGKMTTSIQFRRGSTNDHTLFTGLEGEITVDTSKKTAVVHDNTTAGGTPLAREDLTNVSLKAITDKGIAKANMENVSCDDIANRNIAKQDLSNVSTENIAQKGIMKSDCSNATHLASETEIGPTQFATEEEVLDNTLTTKALNPKNAVNVIKKYVHLPKNYISGFIITKNTDTSIKVDCGEARCTNDQYDIKLNEPIIKHINSYWELGSNFGGIKENTTLSPNTKYYIFAIAKEDSTADIIISANEELNLSDTTATTEFVAQRKIGYFYTDQNMNINETTVTDSNDTKQLKEQEFIKFVPTTTHLYTVPFTGIAFYNSGLKNTAFSRLIVNNAELSILEGHSSGFTRTCISFRVKKGDIVNMTSTNDVNRDCSLTIYKERNI